ncbi:MAG: efflux RND transporter periplasmic adaptor subunit [Proteobacteria bacterium]|nr:efflux RND transporter periplasmic adaptor subunit [Pseudomonadota bacterium]
MRRNAEPVRVIAEPVQINNQLTRIEAVGTSRALQSVTLHPPSAGEIVRINFKPGQHVDAGDVLVELDQRKEKLAVELAQFRLSEAERLFERYRKSAETGATLPTTLDAARTELEAARIELDQAKIALEDRNIIAPFDGHVGITQFDPGDRVQTETPVVTLDNRDSLLVTFDLPELLIDHVNQGSKVQMKTWDQQAQTVDGEVIDIDSRIDPDLRTFVTRAIVSNEQDRLRPGMSFRVTLELPGDPYPVMPQIAVQWGADGAYIWKIVDGHAERVRVRIVQRQQGFVMVSSDEVLDENDIIITEGIQRLRPGLPVSPQTAIARDAATPAQTEATRG